MLATKLLKQIADAINADGGAKYRGLLAKTLPQCGDAYDTSEDDFRSHLGASLIGHECSRYLWYVFHWVAKGSPEAHMRLLWNRGHLEEGRFVAMLQAAGIQVFQHDAQGKQFRVSGVDGYFGGSLDGVLLGVPDLPPNTYALGEFKTHNDKSFTALVKDGVKESKYQHYAQMATYMRKQGLEWAVYLAVNKNTEKLYAEVVKCDDAVAQQLETRAELVIGAELPPKRISERATWYACGWCDFKAVCHERALPAVNCRTCEHVRLAGEGRWGCALTHQLLDKAAQAAACPSYSVAPAMRPD